jgi:capsular polysaccharide biosynthesis protein
MREKIIREISPWLALVTCAAVGGAAAAGYGLTSPHRYKATSQLLVAPVKPSDPTFVGIDVLRDTGGKRTAAASVAALLRAPQIVDAVRAQLALKRTRQSLLDAVDPHVVGDSDVVALTAEDTSPDGAAQLANTFVHALVNQRNASFQSQLATAIRRDEQLVAGGAGSRVKTRLATLQALQSQPDPTVAVVSEAAPPASASWPDRPRLVSTGFGIGAAVGALAAIVLVRLRRQQVVGAPAQYDRGVSDGGLEKLVDRLEGKLTARESALSARERDLRAALEELKAAQATAGPEVADLLGREAELQRRLDEAGEREAELAQRVEALTKREVELARRAAQLAVAERKLTEREAAEKKRAEQEKAERKQAERDRAQRVQAEREHAAQEQAEKERAAQEQAEREEAERVEAERVLAEQPEPEPEPVAAPSPMAGFPGDGSYNLLALERLVEERGRNYPEKAEEWSSYLFFLREYAASDGRVPASFDALIQDTFAELVT